MDALCIEILLKLARIILSISDTNPREKLSMCLLKIDINLMAHSHQSDVMGMNKIWQTQQVF